MKALLIKDTYTLLKQIKLFFALVVFLAVIPGFSTSGFTIVYAALLPITALAYDERAKWNKLAAMMPFSERDLVVSKYILGYLSLMTFFVLCVAVQYGFSFIFDSTLGIELFSELVAVSAVALILMSINLPLVFKLGVEKGRMMFMVITIAVVISGISYSEKYISGMVEKGKNVWQIALAMLLAGIALNIVSLLISIRIFKSREE